MDNFNFRISEGKDTSSNGKEEEDDDDVRMPNNFNKIVIHTEQTEGVVVDAFYNADC